VISATNRKVPCRLISLHSLKSHFVQNLVILPNPLPTLAPLLPLCPRRIFLALKFAQNRCYSNKACASLSGLAREIGCCERTLGDALESCSWVGKTPAGILTVWSSANCAVVRGDGDGDYSPAPCSTTTGTFLDSVTAEHTIEIEIRRLAAVVRRSLVEIQPRSAHQLLLRLLGSQPCGHHRVFLPRAAG
jgi:hypothetical protein